jgi:hypothetical protein
VKVRLLFALGFCAMLAALGAAKEESHDTYMPGAIVTLAVNVQAPVEWALNPQVPLRIEIPEQAVKQANFKVDRTTWDFKVSGHDAAYTAEIPIKISSELPTGKLIVPLKVNCGICTLDESKCTFVNEDVKVKLNVRAKSDAGEGSTPAKKGRLLARHLLVAP